MDNLLALISVAAFIAFLIGLVKPKLVLMPSRGRSCATYAAAFFIPAVIGSTFFPTKKIVAETTDTKVSNSVAPAKFEYADLSLSDYRNKPQTTRHDIIDEYVKFKGIDVNSADSFYSCMSENSLQKSGELSLDTVLDWCYSEYENTPDMLAKRINLDAFQKNFSGWDGSYRPLEKLIKKSMNDDSSYKHVETFSRIVLGKDPHGIVKTTFKGKNAYGAVVKEQVSARVDLKTGDIVSIIED
ncbi:hypothetical protein ABRZ24_20910 [Brenneria populi]|uniref:Uncharacterized protein n=1 Tax=Brenneria populi TaxID=1505588 RepID=A0ABU6JXG6_9GAMM|nr:hypothetical protein [Brenneria populi Li et al. 2015]